ncbi:hypothetical protein EJB05_13177, partial [Eragrostis curvula]
MAPGQKAPGQKGPGQKAGQQTAAATEVNPYLLQRDQNILRNSQALARLGVGRAKELLNRSVARRPKRKATAEDDGFDLDAPATLTIASPATMKGGSSKRVQAPIEQELQQPVRRTRQKTRELSLTEAEATSNQEEDAESDINVSNEGKLLFGDAHVNQMLWWLLTVGGVSMGKGLDKMTKGLCVKISLHISDGKRRPEAPMQAAKFASEGGIILRQHIPILPHWKHYKKDEKHLENYMGKVAGAFAVDIKEKAVIEACNDLLKGGQRQLRYRLKKEYFDKYPANQVPTKAPVPNMLDEDWQALVAIWSEPKHKEKCEKNKANREQVQCMQKTGSRSFIAHCHAVKMEKYKDVEPTLVDLFKDCHISSTKGCTEPVKNAVAAMEAIIADDEADGNATKTPAEVVVEVWPKTTFLRNIGIQLKGKKTNASEDVAAATRVEELEGQLESSNQLVQDMKEQMERMAKQMEESEAARLKQAADMENLKKASVDTMNLIKGLVQLNQQ